ncbi:MAG: Very short patch repair protein [Rhodocyclaceae bacterium]|nr:Very short patch repair protein [Rhodocyclaceae bacterium]
MRRRDPLSPSDRSALMARIRAKNTGPELAVRKLVFSLGYRYRLHRADLPGKPDLVFPGRAKVIFVHGCFWHQHACGRYSIPKSRTRFWKEKLDGNKRRDANNVRRLRALGWRSLVLWECQLRDLEKVTWRIERFLDDCD